MDTAIPKCIQSKRIDYYFSDDLSEILTNLCIGICCNRCGLLLKIIYYRFFNANEFEFVMPFDAINYMKSYKLENESNRHWSTIQIAT